MFKLMWVYTLVLLTFSQVVFSKQPDWIMNPVADSELQFYSSGAGKNIELAKKNALENLSGRLIVSVENESSTFAKKSSSMDNLGNVQNQIDRQYLSESLHKTEKLTFYKAEVIRNHQMDGMTYVLIATDKEQVFQSVRDKLQRSLVTLIEQADLPAQQLLANGLKLDLVLPQQQKYLSLLEAYEQPVADIKSKLLRFQNEYAELRQKISFKVIDSGESTAELKLIKTLLIQELNANGFGQSGNHHQLAVVIVGPEKLTAEVNGQYAIKLMGDILYSLDGQLIYSQAINAFDFGSDTALVRSSVMGQVTEQFSTN